MKTMLDMNAFEGFQTKGREGMEAAMASFSAWTNGWQAIADRLGNLLIRRMEGTA